MITVLERFLKYVRINTASSENSEINPTSSCQFDLAKILKDELILIGLDDVYLDKNCYVYAKLPASSGYESCKSIGLIAHLDTIPDYPGQNVTPQTISNYDGADVILGTSGKTLKVKQFSHLANLKGHTLITTNGLTVLGADDKAGIAEIITAIDEIICNNIPHGEINVCFMPDEEVYLSTKSLDLQRFNPYCAYTVDCNDIGELIYENFNACKASFNIKGFNIHTGEAKDKLINAGLIAIEINNLLPANEVPSKTDHYEGFFHLVKIEGVEEKAYLEYLVRDHHIEEYNSKKELLKYIEQQINEKYGFDTAILTITEQYQNMAQIVTPNSDVVQKAVQAIRNAGFSEYIRPCRGSSTGGKLSFMGIPCPDIGTGGYAFHGPYEHITAERMDDAVSIIIQLVKEFSIL